MAVGKIFLYYLHLERDPDKYDDLKEEYHSIYKIYEGGSATIQLFPTFSPHKIASDIVMFEAYLVDEMRKNIKKKLKD